MTLVIGTDEAGYGPNLGPLAVAASAWRLDGGVADAEAVFAAMAAALADPGGPLWADSKQLYRAGDGFSELERGVLAALGIVGAAPGGWPTLAATLGQVGPQAGADTGWDHLASLSLPRGTDPAECRTSAARAAPVLKAARVELLGLACRAVYPAEFNRLLDSGLNKSDILSRTTLDLAAELLDRFGPGEAAIWCDRHGGRKGYAALVARHFSAPLVQPLEESAARSAYRVPARGVQIEFTVGGESRLPVALASMTAKYVRELAMAAFNMFWGDRLPGLVPTAGYPVDARRWRGDADAAIRATRIPADQLWRRA